jgi:hypothetical protein
MARIEIRQTLTSKTIDESPGMSHNYIIEEQAKVHTDEYHR